MRVISPNDPLDGNGEASRRERDALFRRILAGAQAQTQEVVRDGRRG